MVEEGRRTAVEATDKKGAAVQGAGTEREMSRAFLGLTALGRQPTVWSRGDGPLRLHDAQNGL